MDPECGQRTDAGGRSPPEPCDIRSQIVSVETLGPAALEELKLARLLVADLLEPNGKRYWTDLAAGAAVGWGAFGLACAATSPFWTIAAGLISALALYRIF